MSLLGFITPSWSNLDLPGPIQAINWPPTRNRMDQCVCLNVMKFFNGIAPAYSAEIFHPANLGRIT